MGALELLISRHAVIMGGCRAHQAMRLAEIRQSTLSELQTMRFREPSVMTEKTVKKTECISYFPKISLIIWLTASFVRSKVTSS